MKPYYQNELTAIYNGDCLEVMDYLIEKGIKVDAIITDPPYGTTACKWDNVIPFDKMWERLNKLSNKTTPIILFGSQPFTSTLVLSNIDEYKYDWVWDKVQKGNFLNALKQPLRSNELISVFYKNQCTYNPQMTTGHIKKEVKNIKRKTVDLYNEQSGTQNYSSTERFPHSIITFPKDTQTSSLHPTQKPIALLQYLIKTYTNKNDLILDFTSGSFTTSVASEQLGRRSIGIELEQKYCDIGIKRLNSLQIKFDI